MRVSALTLLISLAVGAFSSPDDSVEPELLITAHFSEENPFHHVVNGEKNKLYLLVENKSEQNTTIKSIAGSFHDPESQKLVKNLSALTYGVESIAGSKFTIPFSFHSELKPGDYGLHVWVDHVLEGASHRVTAYEGVVKVVEPDLSIFDFKMISTYAITAAILVMGLYFGVHSLFPSLSKLKKKRAKAAEGPSVPVSTVKASGAGYEEEWIPEHHLKTTSRRGQKKTMSEGSALSSGDEKVASGPESSPEGVRRSKRNKRT